MEIYLIGHSLLNYLEREESSENRFIAQSLSLFNSIGVEGDVRKEMVFVATNKNITILDGDDKIKENKFDKLIQDYLGRRLLDRRGHFFLFDLSQLLGT